MDVPADSDRTFSVGPSGPDTSASLPDDTEIPTHDFATVDKANHGMRGKRRVMRGDTTTSLRNTQITQRQHDRSSITKPRELLRLPRDRRLLQLREMQRSKKFVGTCVGDDRMEKWAPELREMLSLGRIQEAGRKRRERVELVLPGSGRRKFLCGSSVVIG